MWSLEQETAGHWVLASGGAAVSLPHLLVKLGHMCWAVSRWWDLSTGGGSGEPLTFPSWSLLLCKAFFDRLLEASS